MRFARFGSGAAASPGAARPAPTFPARRSYEHRRDAASPRLGGALGRKPASYSQVPTEEAAADAASPPDDEEAGALGPPPDAEPPKAPTPDAAKAV